MQTFINKRKQQENKNLFNVNGFLLTELLVIGALLAVIALSAALILRYNSSKQNSVASNSDGATASLIPKAQRYWIMDAPVIKELASNPEVNKTLINDTIFVPVKKDLQIVKQLSGLRIVPVESFSSEAQLARAIQTNSISSSIKVLLYDNEDWALTPQLEQANLVSYYQRAASLAHSHGYLLIGTPVSKVNSQAAIQIAPYVDVLDIQSQYDQASATNYAQHVLPLAEGARQANQNLIILSGLSTNPPAGIPTAQQLLADALTVTKYVQGYWLNVPTPGAACPNCNLPQPQIGIDFINLLGSKP
ncbi:MAG TPA: hypothetical protein VFN51_01260 [Candidatus Saccharimonadales bacterium]|nr:hypothetical protein [Candidatus Saccharimonadales bacterium]